MSRNRHEEKNYFLVLLALLSFGIAYNSAIDWLEKRGYERGFTSLLVAIGCLVTIGGIWPIRGLRDTAAVIGLFIASGTPMIIGSICRYLRDRNDEQTANRKMAGVLWDETKRG